MTASRSLLNPPPHPFTATEVQHDMSIYCFSVSQVKQTGVRSKALKRHRQCHIPQENAGSMPRKSTYGLSPEGSNI
jgi:hypothetical protein